MPGSLPLSGVTSVYYKQFLFLLDILVQFYNKTRVANYSSEILL